MGNIGDIYYFDKGKKPKDLNSWHLYWFEVADDNTTLFIQGWNLDPGWPKDWRSSLLPNLRPLAVSTVSGSPRLIGWADDSLSTLNFTVPTPKPKSLELIICADYYYLFKLGSSTSMIPSSIKPTFRNCNKLLRNLGSLPLPKLSDWPITHIDTTHHLIKKLYGTPSIDWTYRFKHIHNCSFLLPKYSQLIYYITTNTLKSGQWLAIIKRPDTPGTCPHCVRPPDPSIPDAQPSRPLASTIHMFWQCTLAKEVWAEADQLGHSFWPDYTNFNYHRDITILVHDYNPVTLFKLAVIWSLWRYWCELFYQPENFNHDRLSTLVPEIMLMIRDELLLRLSESRGVIQWLQIVKDRRAEGEEQHIPEKQFLLVNSQAVKTNPKDFNDIDFPLENSYIRAWIGNNVLCYTRGKKLVFNHSNWYVYKSQLDCNLDPPYSDPESDIDPDIEPLPGRSAAFMTMDY